MFVLKNPIHFSSSLRDSTVCRSSRVCPLRTDKVKKDCKAWKEQDAAEEQFHGQSTHLQWHTTYVTVTSLHTYSLMCFQQCSVLLWCPLCCRTSWGKKKKETKTEQQQQKKHNTWEFKRKKKRRNTKDQWKDNWTFAGNQLFECLFSHPWSTRCKPLSSTLLLNKTSLFGMQLWKCRQWIYMRRAPSSFHASLADLYKLVMTLAAASHVLLQ